MPESKRPSGAPGTPEVTECGSPANVQRTTSPTLTDRDAGLNWKLTAATLTVDALADPNVSTTRLAKTTADVTKRRVAASLVWGASIVR
jgi:hypothetical protein